MKKHNLVVLYDYYGNLLTENQQKIFEDTYFHDHSLAEVSEINNVSRNAIHKQLKSIEEKLNHYEDKLGLMKKREEILKIVKAESLVADIDHLI